MADGAWKIGFLALFFFLIIGAMTAMAYLAGQGKLPFSPPKTQPQTSPTATAIVEPSPEAQTGIIEGSLSYPSEGIPETMKVCAENSQAQEKFCSDKHLKNSKYQYGVGYQLEVPPGNYKVYAFLPQQPENKAYYSKAVPCGLTIACTDHEPILVSVNAGEVIVNVDPQDWYAPVLGTQVNDDLLLKQAVYTKTGLSETKAEVTINQNTGNHAKGSVKEYDAVGGAYWLAAKTASEWVVVYAGQANPTCEEIAPYNFPTTLVSECLDTTGNVVNR